MPCCPHGGVCLSQLKQWPKYLLLGGAVAMCSESSEIIAHAFTKGPSDRQAYDVLLTLQVLFNVVQQARPEIPSFSELPGMPGSQLPRWVLQAMLRS